MILNMSIRFQKSSPKITQIQNFWSQIQALFFFHQILQLGKFEGTDFNYDSSIFKYQSKNAQMRHLCFKFRHYFSFTKFCSQTNLRALILIMIIVFSNSSPKIPNSGVFGPKLTEFYFCTKLQNQANLRVLMSNMTKIPSQKNPNKVFSVINL